jgi:hypothetical protein
MVKFHLKYGYIFDHLYSQYRLRVIFSPDILIYMTYHILNFYQGFKILSAIPVTKLYLEHIDLYDIPHI